VAAWALLVIVQLVSPLWYATPDACAYLSIARSIATTGQPTNLGSPHLRYGVGYPFLISPVFLWQVSPFLILSLVNAALAILYVIGTYLWVRRHVPQASLLIALLAAGNVIVLCILRRPLSEAFFLPLMIWLLNAWDGVRREDGSISWLHLLAAAVLISTLVVIRQAGIMFAAGFGLQMMICAYRRTCTWQRAAGLTLAVGVPAVLAVGAMIAVDNRIAAENSTWSHWDVLLRSPGTVASDFGGQSLWEQCLEGTRVRITEIGRLIVPGMFNSYRGDGSWLDLNMIVYFPLFVLCVVGWARFVRRRSDAFALTLPLYAALYIYWPFNQSARFFAPLLPLLLVSLWFALEWLGQWRLRLLKILVVAHMAVALGYWLAIDRPHSVTSDRQWSEIRQMAHVIRNQPGRVQVASDLRDTTCLFLQYVLDEPVSRQERRQPLDVNAAWLVMSVDAPLPEGFKPCEDFGSFRLLHRFAASANP
jgi:hypothetical protein